MNRSIKIGLMVFLGALVTSCSQTITPNQSDRTIKKKDEELMEALDQLTQVDFQDFYTKISTNYADSAQDISFKTSLRIVNDSAINATITYLRIPAQNLLATNERLNSWDSSWKELLPSLNKDICTCIPDPLIPSMGFGANDA